jgi:hypothetical protein
LQLRLSVATSIGVVERVHERPQVHRRTVPDVAAPSGEIDHNVPWHSDFSLEATVYKSGEVPRDVHGTDFVYGHCAVDWQELISQLLTSLCEPKELLL